MIQKLIPFLLLILLVACDSQSSSLPKYFSNRKINIVTTTGMIADIAKNIGGERVDVISLMGPGIDPHLYKASEGDVTRMAQADMIFYNGLHLEGKMAEVFEKMRSRIKTVAVTEKIDSSRLQTPPEFAGNYDPHLWFDVRLWMEAAKHLGQSLIDADSVHQTIYKENMAKYLSRLDSLHTTVLEKAQTVPKNKRVLVTAHDAFNYFGHAYGFEVRGLQGISTATETGTGDVQSLATFIVDRKIPALFVESSVPVRYIEALQAAVKAKGFDVKIGGSLFSDAMGNAGTFEGTYIGMVTHNINTITTALKE